MFARLAVLLFASLLCSSAGAQEVRTRSFELHAFVTAGFAGERSLRITDDGGHGGRYRDESMRPTPGGYLGAGYGFGRWFALEAGLGLLAFRDSVMKDASQGRELLLTAVLRPRLRWVQGRLELYFVTPMGVARPLANDDTAAAFGISGVDLEGKPRLTLGAAVGAAVQLSEHVALRGELGYHAYWLTYQLEGVTPPTELRGGFHQLTTAFGASYVF